MIVAYINKHICYPSTQENIKIVLDNPFVKDGDEKSMEVVFPLSVPENRAVFGFLDRLDTTFETQDYPDCRLLVDNFEVISGVGTITAINPDEVRLQILSGKNYLKYRSDFDKVFIDMLDYGSVLTRHIIMQKQYASTKDALNIWSEYNSQGFIGDPGRYAFMPTHDESNDFYVNMPSDLIDGGSPWRKVGVNITNMAIQPNLMMVLNTVLQKLGYSVIENSFNVSPWSNIYICSAKLGLSMAKALPHWSAYKFFDEFRKTFNASFIFDDKNKTVRVIKFDESALYGSEVVEPADDFKSSFDESGINYIGASNLEYTLSSCGREPELLSNEVLENFTLRDYPSYDQMVSAYGRLTDKDKFTSIFHCPFGYYYHGTQRWYRDPDSWDSTLVPCGSANPLVRREGSDAISLKISPVACEWQNVEIWCAPIGETISKKTGSRIGYGPVYGTDKWSMWAYIPNVECDAQEEWGASATVDDTPDYVSVKEVLEEQTSIPSKESDDSLMQIMFVSGKMQYITVFEKVKRLWDYEPQSVYLPTAYTDWAAASHAVSTVAKWSMALHSLDNTISYIGKLHASSLQIKRNVNGNNEIVVPFLYKGKPDSKKIFLMRNKRYIASKIELQVTEKGIDDIKTGYFYEVL